MLTYNLCNSQPTMFFLQWEQSDNEIQIQRTRKPGNKNSNKDWNKNQRQNCSPVSNVSAPSSPQRHQSGVYDTNRFVCNFFYLMCLAHLYWSTGGWWTPSLPLPPTWYLLAGSPFSYSSTRWSLLSDMRGMAGWPTWPPDLPMLSKSLQSSGIWKMCV